MAHEIFVVLIPDRCGKYSIPFNWTCDLQIMTQSTVSLIWQTNNEGFNIEHSLSPLLTLQSIWQGYT